MVSQADLEVLDPPVLPVRGVPLVKPGPRASLVCLDPAVSEEHPERGDRRESRDRPDPRENEASPDRQVRTNLRRLVAVVDKFPNRMLRDYSTHRNSWTAR